MKLKKIVAVAVGVGLCVGGEVWGAESECYEIPVVVQPGETEGTRDVFLLLKSQDIEPIEPSGDFKAPIFNGKEQKKENIKDILIDLEPYVFSLTNDNINLEKKDVKKPEIKKGGTPKKSHISYTINATTISSLKLENQGYLLENFLPTHFTGFTDRLVKNKAFIDKDLVNKLLTNSTTDPKKTNLKLIRKAAIKKFEDKFVKAGGEKDPTKEGEADEPETEMVKAIGVAVNPQGDVFFMLSTGLEKPTETVIIFTGKVKVPKGEPIEDIKKFALFEPSKTDDFYYSYITTNPKDPIPHETLIYDHHQTPNLVGYLIKSNAIPKLTDSTGGNYSIPDLTELHVTEMDAQGKQQPEKSYKESPLKDKQLFIDGKIVKWLNQEGHLEMIKNAAIKKFTEAAALDNLTNTLYKLTLPAH